MKMRERIRGKELGRPLAVAAVVAVLSAAAFLIVEFGPWNRQAPEQPDQAATREVAQSVGAKVIPTQPKLAVEPTPPGPKPVQPPSPAQKIEPGQPQADLPYAAEPP
jgi:hypothetical protein